MHQNANRRLQVLTKQFVETSASSNKGSAFQATSGVESKVPSFEHVIVERKGRVGLVWFNRPKQFNALSDALVSDFCSAIGHLNKDQDIGCIVVTGKGKAFAAGADIKEMASKSYYEMSTHDKIEPWDMITKSRLPIIAAVNGLAVGGGCEIAMMCDIIFAAASAKFGQPEIKLGTIPGAGGTQRLTRAVGKSKAMEYVLTGRLVTAEEAERAGLISAVLPDEQLLAHAMTVAATIAAYSRPVVRLCKEAVGAAFETTLQEGAHIERRLFHSTFALADQKEGMSAFAEKRAANFTHR